jgi:alkanesulfonate monooxygenase SsuD/methylene tetrahydromethanopterin reductase-like flavin-dependent oxidoreductase (luciferase family)
MNVDHVFTYHPPNTEDQEKYKRIRAAAKALAQTIMEDCPSCADRTTALREVRAAVMWANASIALDGRLD